MDPIFAPWRMDWITRDDPNEGINECIFCELPEEGADKENRILARSGEAYVVLNKAPYTPGHLLVVPFAHADNVAHLNKQAVSGTFGLVQVAVKAIDRTLYPDGYNIGMNIGEAGGASIEDHLHVHVVPRWKGDTTFMPTISNTKVVAEALDETYERLYEAFLEFECADGGDGSQAVIVS